MPELAEALGLHNNRAERPDGWAFVMAAGLIAYGIGLGLVFADMADAALVVMACAFGLIWAALILKR